MATTSYAWIAYAEELTAAYRKIRDDGILNPGQSFWQQERVWEEIEKRVVDRDADIGIYAYPPSRTGDFPDELVEVNWIEEDFVLVLPMDIARRINRERLSIRELAEIMGTLPRVVHYSPPIEFR